MLEITSGSVVLFYLFDIAETVRLEAVPALVQGAIPSRLTSKSATPAYVQYDKPPLLLEGQAVGVGEVEGFRARFRVYDYGVISLALTRPFSGSWDELVLVGQQFIENAELESRAEALCRHLAGRLQPALIGHRRDYLSEDYLVFAVHEVEPHQSAEQLLHAHGARIAAMLRGERQLLSRQEQDQILRHGLSYLADDLVVPSWNAAFVYDSPAGAQGALEILEFANSQLLEFRYYDDRLDRELTSIYARLQKPRWYDKWLSAKHTRAARQVHALFIDVNELTDRTENTLKFIGDIYAARLFGLVADRLGLSTWKANVESKLETLDDIYRFAVEQSSMSRGQFLELIVVLILVLELVLIFLGVST